MKKIAALLQTAQIMYQNHSASKACKWNKLFWAAFVKFVKKNVATGINHKRTKIDVDSLNDYFANIGNSLASGSNCSKLEETIISKSIDKTIFLYPTDANEL